jgi:membrane-associated phospholipid phosphatase
MAASMRHDRWAIDLDHHHSSARLSPSTQLTFPVRAMILEPAPRVRTLAGRAGTGHGRFVLRTALAGGCAMPFNLNAASLRRVVNRALPAAFLAMSVVAPPLLAQQTRIAFVVRPDSTGTLANIAATPLTRSDTSDLVPLFGWRDAAIAAGFGVATIALFQVDRHVAEQSQDEVTQANRFLRNVTKPSEALAWPGSLLIEGGLYALGKLSHHPRTAEVGWHGAEAIIVATAATNVLKKLVGRARPYVSGDPHDFKFGGGFQAGHDRSSFPSGHTTTAFAFASAVASESRQKWPKEWWSAWLIPVGVYGGATVVGISRLYHNAHWASDVALGAAIGTFSGIKVIQYTHRHPNNVVDRIMLGTTVLPNARGGMTLIWSNLTR